MASLASFVKRQPRLILLSVVVASALAVGFTYTGVFVFKSSGGSLSPYLVGYFDLRTDECPSNGAACADRNTDGIVTNRTDVAIDLSNPTRTALRAIISVFDQNGNFINCTTQGVVSNETNRVYVNQGFFGNGNGRFGVIKIVSFLPDFTLFRIQSGLKGWITHYVVESSDNSQAIFTRHSRLQEVPVEVLKRTGNRELGLITQGGCL